MTYTMDDGAVQEMLPLGIPDIIADLSDAEVQAIIATAIHNHNSIHDWIESLGGNK